MLVSRGSLITSNEEVRGIMKIANSLKAFGQW